MTIKEFSEKSGVRYAIVRNAIVNMDFYEPNVKSIDYDPAVMRKAVIKSLKESVKRSGEKYNNLRESLKKAIDFEV